MSLRDAFRSADDDRDADVLGDADENATAEEARASAAGSGPQTVVHRLRAPNERAAQSLLGLVRNKGYEADAQPSAGGEVQIVARKVMPLDEQHLGEARAALEGLARDHGGDYDGWDAESTATPSP